MIECIQTWQIYSLISCSETCIMTLRFLGLFTTKIILLSFQEFLSFCVLYMYEASDGADVENCDIQGITSFASRKWITYLEFRDCSCNIYFYNYYINSDIVQFEHFSFTYKYIFFRNCEIENDFQ